MRAVDPVPGRSGPPLRVMMTADAVGGVWVFACGLARELAKATSRGRQLHPALIAQ